MRTDNGSPASMNCFKVAVIGDTNVGKTCLICRASSGKWPLLVDATIGVDFRDKKMDVKGEKIMLQLWDTAGQERFRHSLVPHYYRNVHAVIFVYDVTRKESFENLQRWIDEFHVNVTSARRIPQVIIGNKCDLHADREVRTSEAKSYANHCGLPLWETSAKSELEADTIEAIFQSIAESLQLHSPLLEFPPHLASTIKLHQRNGLSVNQSVSISTSDSQNGVQSRYFSRKAKVSDKSKSCACG